jgi:hypothetical protein
VLHVLVNPCIHPVRAQPLGQLQYAAPVLFIFRIVRVADEYLRWHWGLLFQMT